MAQRHPAGREDFWAQRDRRRALDSLPRRRRRSRLTALLGFVAATVAPALLWHRLVIETAAEFRLDFAYLVIQWSPWVLIVAGLAFLVPVVASAGRDSQSRWYPRARRVYAGWGVTLYLLGTALAVQVSQIHALNA